MLRPLSAMSAGCILLAAGCSQVQPSKVQSSSWPGSDQALACCTSQAPSQPEASGGDAPVRAAVVSGDSASDRQMGWLALAQAEARKEAAAAPAPEEAASRQGASESSAESRRGPAHPGDFWRSFGRDAKELPLTLWDDTKATFTDKWALIGLGAAAGVGAILDATNSNGSVADHFSEHGSQLNTFWDTVGDAGGNPGTHFAVAGAMYFGSLYAQDVKTYEVSKALINALALNGLTTLALKGIANSESPNGDNFGWPSGHTSSSFCLATVMNEAYGPWVGVPLYGFATFVGYERIDARNHDFNDVISGAIIGIAIGHAVYQNHRPRVLGMDVMPYVDPEKGSVGVALSKAW